MELLLEQKMRMYDEKWYINKPTEKIESWYESYLTLLEQNTLKKNTDAVLELSFHLDVMGSVLVERMIQSKGGEISGTNTTNLE